MAISSQKYRLLEQEWREQKCIDLTEVKYLTVTWNNDAWKGTGKGKRGKPYLDRAEFEKNIIFNSVDIL